MSDIHTYTRAHHQLVVLSCLSIAMKVDSPAKAFSSKEISDLCLGAYTPAEIRSEEMCILQALGWYINPPTANQIANHVLALDHFWESCDKATSIAAPPAVAPETPPSYPSSQTLPQSLPQYEGLPWTSGFFELERYKSEHGDCNVTQSEGSLGRWVDTQRTSYKRNEMPKHRIDLLNGVDFAWVAPNASTDVVPWTSRFEELERYKSEHGNCIVPQSEGSLGRWVKKQRARYRENKMPQCRIDLLNGVDFAWVIREASLRPDELPTWEDRFKELVQYRTVHGNCNVPQSEGSLGLWVKNQRTAHKEGKLSEERVQNLEGICFCFNPGLGMTAFEAGDLTFDLGGDEKSTPELIAMALHRPPRLPYIPPRLPSSNSHLNDLVHVSFRAPSSSCMSFGDSGSAVEEPGACLHVKAYGDAEAGESSHTSRQVSIGFGCVKPKAPLQPGNLVISPAVCPKPIRADQRAGGSAIVMPKKEAVPISVESSWSRQEPTQIP